MSDAEDNVDALFESSDEDEAPQKQPRSQEGAPAADAANDQLRQSEGDDASGQHAAASSDEDAAAEPLTANRRFAQDDEAEEGSDDDERRQQRGPSEMEPGPPLELEGPLLKGPDHKDIRLVRASNILGVQSKPFSPETHVWEPEENVDEDTGRVTVRMANAIRWRHVQQPDGSTARESNARFVRWSDGSLQLFVGDEVLDVAEIDVSDDHHYMYVRHRGFIQAQAQLATRMAFRPSSTKSAAHRRLAAVMDKHHGFKGARIRSTTTMVDPNREKAQRAKLEEARIRDREGLQKRQEKEMRKYARAPARPAAGGLSAAYLEAADEEGEEEEGEEGEPLTASERARQALARPRRDARDEEEAERRLASAKRGAPPGPSQPAKRQRAAYDEEEEEDEEMGDFIADEEEEEEEAVRARKPAAGRRRLALSDEEDD